MRPSAADSELASEPSSLTLVSIGGDELEALLAVGHLKAREPWMVLVLSKEMENAKEYL